MHCFFLRTPFLLPSPLGRRWRGRSPCRMRGYGLSIVRDPITRREFARSFATLSTRGGEKVDLKACWIEPLFKALPAIGIIISAASRILPRAW